MAVRRRYVYDETQKRMVEVSVQDYRESGAPIVIPDLPGYVSPVTGLWVEGRKARREDLKRTGCRPYEGREQEEREAARQRAYDEQAMDRLAEKMAHRAWAEAPERVRKVFRGR